MKTSLRLIILLLIFCNTSVSAQIKLIISYHGDKEEIKADLYKYVNLIVPIQKKQGETLLLKRGVIKTFDLNTDRPLKLSIAVPLVSEDFFIQPSHTYSIIIEDENISIRSNDRINEAIQKLDSAIEKYYDELFLLVDRESKVNMIQIEEMISGLEYFGDAPLATDFHEQLIRYKVAIARNVTYGLFKEKEKYYQLEKTYLLDCELQLNNPAYIDFLFDHYFRRIRQLDLLKSEYSDDHTVFEIINLEVATISNPAIQQIALLMLSNEAYNSNWVKDNTEVIQVFDSLMITGLEEQIRNTANELADRVTNLQPGSEIPDFSFLNMDGNEVKLSQYFEKYILLDFWFIGCRPCEIANPHKVRLYEKYGDNLEILSINNHNNLAEIANYKNKKGYPWTFLKIDKNDSVLSTLNIQSYPTYYLLDHEGKIILNPKRNDSVEKMFRNIESVLSERCK
jgi:thiol-disulfide isomerase/thioredoxin